MQIHRHVSIKELNIQHSQFGANLLYTRFERRGSPRSTYWFFEFFARGCHNLYRSLEAYLYPYVFDHRSIDLKEHYSQCMKSIITESYNKNLKEQEDQINAEAQRGKLYRNSHRIQYKSFDHMEVVPNT